MFNIYEFKIGRSSKNKLIATASWYASFFADLAKQRAFPFVAGMVAFLLYLGIACFVLAPDALWSPDAGAKLWQLHSLRLENGRLAYDLIYLGRELDPDLQFADFVPERNLINTQNGALYFRRLPLFPLLTLPFFRWFGFYGLYILPALGGAACSTVALGLLPRHQRRFSMWLFMAFGSPIFIYATIFWEHTLATSLGLFAAWWALRMRSLKTRWHKVLSLAMIGALLALSVYIRLEMIIFAGALLLAYWLLIPTGRWWGLWAGIAVGVIMLLYGPLHSLLFSQSLPDNATYLFYPFAYLRDAGWQALPDLLVGPAIEEAIEPGWLGGLWSIAALIALACSFSTTTFAHRLKLFSLAVTALIAISFLYHSTYYRSAHGLLFTTPWALLGLCRSSEIWRRGDVQARVIVLTTILGLIGYIIGILILRAAPPHGGLEWGARFAITYYPLLALMSGWEFKPTWHHLPSLLLVGVFFYLGFGFQLRGLGTIYVDKQINRSLNQAILATSDRHLLSDVWWLQLNAAPIHGAKAIYLANTPPNLAHWVELAADKQIRHFTLVTFDEALPDKINPILSNHTLRVTEVEQLEAFFVHQLTIEPK